MKLYKEEKVNPLSSCLPLLLQLPFLIAIYQVFINGLHAENLRWLYPFIQNPGSLQSVAFGFLDLSKASIVLAVITGATQYWQTKMLATARPPKAMPGAKDEDMAAIMNRQMQIMMPAMTVIIGISLPSGLVLYWLATTVLTIAQQYLMFKPKQPAQIKS